MSELGDYYRDVREFRRRRGVACRRDARCDCDDAAELANAAGLSLFRCTDAHYQLTNGTWLVNIYPGNRRLYWDENKPRGPFLKLPERWTLADVVRAAIDPSDANRKDTA